MKNYVFGLLFLGLVLGGCNEDSGITTDAVNNPETASGEPDFENLPIIEFGVDRHDFGTITQGESVEHIFTFKNTGKSDLFITSASSTCGCTIPDWPKKPIPPGGTGEIPVIFNSANKSGKITKKVSIVANTQPSNSIVVMAGHVVAPESD